MTRAEADLAERQPSQALTDMRVVAGGMLDSGKRGEPTKMQKMLDALFKDNPTAFLDRLEKLQTSHDKKIAAIEKREAAQSQSPGAVQEVDEGHESNEKLLAELIAGFDPVEEALRLQHGLRKDGSPFDVVAEAERYARERQSRQPMQ